MSKKKWRWKFPAPLFFKIELLLSYLFRTDLWTPLVEAAFVPVDDVRHDHSGDGKDQDADKDFIGLERGAGYGDHEPNPRRGSIQLADHNSDQSAPYRQAESSQDERNR